MVRKSWIPPDTRESSPPVRVLLGSVPALPDITVYWRPGCPFCGSLFRQLERADVPHVRVNIWDDPEAAAIVRGIARGNETVPTVTVGDVGLVNPDVRQILALVGDGSDAT
jgi:mycoredoxin